jgi:hypothetical protein
MKGQVKSTWTNFEFAVSHDDSSLGSPDYCCFHDVKETIISFIRTSSWTNHKISFLTLKMLPGSHPLQSYLMECGNEMNYYFLRSNRTSVIPVIKGNQ